MPDSRPDTRFIFVTGGVVSSLGKGIAAASIGRLLVARGLRVQLQKFDPYINVDPGTMSPYQHGEVFVLFGLAATLGGWTLKPLAALGLFVGPVLVIGLYDLRERALLGDTGSNLIGALAGLWIVLTWPPTGQAVALAVILGVTIYGEFRSISKLIERVPLLRQLDSAGRPTHA